MEELSLLTLPLLMHLIAIISNKIRKTRTKAVLGTKVVKKVAIRIYL